MKRDITYLVTSLYSIYSMNTLNRIPIYSSYLFSIFLFLLSIINLISELGLNEWDTDHEIYFAQRLLHGELLFMREFHDKLPLVQYYFVPSALLKDVNYTLIMNFLLVLLSAISVIQIVKMLLRFSDTVSYSHSIYSLYSMAFSTYVYMFTEFNGGFYHINPAAASFFVFFVACFFQYNLKSSGIHDSRNKTTYLLIGAFFAFAAVSFRPYYFSTVLLLVFWTSSRDIFYVYIISERLDSLLIPIIGRIINLFVVLLFSLFMCVIVYILLLYIIPYYYFGSLSSLYYALRLLMNKLNPQGPLYIITHEYEYFLSLSVFSKSIIITSVFSFPVLICMKKFHLLKFPHNLPNADRAISNIVLYDLLFWGPLSLICLNFSVITQHYWDHYWQLCIPFFIVTNVLTVYYVFSIFRFYKLDISMFTIYYDKFVTYKPLLSVLFGIFLVALFPFDYSNTRLFLTSVISSTYRIIDPAPVVLDIDPILNHRKSLGLHNDFLFTHNMFYHWILSESRHGFPHASHFGHIDQMWFANLRISPLVMGIVATPSALCRKLNYTGPTLLFVPKSSRIYSCLVFEEPRLYSIETWIQSNTIAVFVRHLL